MANTIDSSVVAVEFSEKISYTNVKSHDRDLMKHILQEIVKFEKPYPALDIDIHDVGDHYNISVMGYNKNISMIRWVNKFHGPNRKKHLEYCQSTDITPSDGVLVLRVKKRDFSDNRATPRKGRKR